MRLTKITILLTFGLLFLLNACKTDEPKPVQYDSYLPMSVGNYWIYQHFKINADGTEVPLNIFDSVYIYDCRIENNTTYFSFFTRPLNSNTLSILEIIPSQLCDSVGYLVENLGGKYKKFFSSINFKDTISTNPIYDQTLKRHTMTIKSKMENGITATNVPAGNFNVMSKNEFVSCFYYKNKENSSELVLDKTIQVIQPILFAKDIGLVKKTYHWYADLPRENAPSYEIRLLRYHVKGK